MDSRERLLIAINNEKPDRLPCQVHSWMDYYLKMYLGGIDQFQAYEYFGMDAVIYIAPRYIFNERDLTKWQIDHRELGQDQDRNWQWTETITTPDGILMWKGARNAFTEWTTEFIIKSEEDFEVWNKYVPVPKQIDWTPVVQAKRKIGKGGIVRGWYFDFGQGSPWQSFCTLYGTEQAIMVALDKPEWVRYALGAMLDKKLKVIENGGRCEYDLVETGGGAGSNTVISPKLHREFCLPYDKKQHEALHAVDAKIVYHLCGGVMDMLDIVDGNGADGLETMTPPSMGGDCNLSEAYKMVGKRLFFIGGFDQNMGFERGTPEMAKRLVYECHKACPEGGYICSPSDHFFFGDPDNIQAFVNAVKKCVYNK